ncbi:MAG: amidohydrolase family protein, partial [Bacteroidota bacterium]
MQKLSADYLFSPDGWLRDHVLEIDEADVIHDVRPLQSGESGVRPLRGTLCPGFVNAHCHLELSMLRDTIPEHTGMTGFIGQVVRQRQAFSEGAQIQAAQIALQEMKARGIVALGDICNTALTATIKQANPDFLCYNFVERLGLRPEQADQIITDGQKIATQFDGQPTSLSPHAPYSMSSELLRALYQSKPERISIHLLESLEERQLFDEGRGPFLDFFAAIKAPKPESAGTIGAVAHILADHSGDTPTLLVHNTEIRPEELA